jgi:hypothetical protein
MDHDPSNVFAFDTKAAGIKALAVVLNQSATGDLETYVAGANGCHRVASNAHDGQQ